MYTAGRGNFVYDPGGMTPEMRQRLEQAARAVAERNQAIRDAYNEGASLREIAAIVGLSHTGIRKIINIEEK